MTAREHSALCTSRVKPKADSRRGLRSKEPQATERAVDQLFNLVLDLYEVGARNFLFVDVPPIERSPAGKLESLKTRSSSR
jgi:hypothetical protein